MDLLSIGHAKPTIDPATLRPWTAVVAMDKNGLIGQHNKLPWRIKEDLQFFKELTSGHAVVVGRNTYWSLPLLKNRKIIVISSSLFQMREVTDYSVIVLPRLEFVDGVPLDEGTKIFICGGYNIYRQAVPSCRELYITHVNRVIEPCDFSVYFPEGVMSHLTKQETIKETEEFTIIRYFV